MTNALRCEERSGLTLFALIPFLFITFTIAWRILALYIFLSEPMTRTFGELSGTHPLFNASRGSILLPALFHFQLINPLWPAAQPHENYLFVAMAVLLVWFKRKSLLTRHGAVTAVMPQKTT